MLLRTLFDGCMVSRAMAVVVEEAVAMVAVLLAADGQYCLCYIVLHNPVSPALYINSLGFVHESSGSVPLDPSANASVAV